MLTSEMLKKEKVRLWNEINSDAEIRWESNSQIDIVESAIDRCFGRLIKEKDEETEFTTGELALIKNKGWKLDDKNLVSKVTNQFELWISKWNGYYELTVYNKQKEDIVIERQNWYDLPSLLQYLEENINNSVA